ncbi:Pirin protein [Chondromyces apiculatus DSM 436]|uniref:Pirin protein n=2 Tax=Chondromyces apiculatus TaxID=51 RepID=A0A017TGT3_9BACT|nr:pirin family protein [Chondromyces apiculatus]EYF07826.1 Pirin protein [Chondromyces apiculatus DSM 436]
MDRRTALGTLATAPVLAACAVAETSPAAVAEDKALAEKDVIRTIETLGAPPWKTPDPFLFCVHHDDAYPAGNPQLGPSASLEGRDIGQDFAGKDGWRMYHGDVVPGFPAHPHRGFETVTVVRRGLVDHSDSLGATARYGGGDVQWLTAGKGIVHAEMMPLLNQEGPNPLELFQLWLNLPRADKMAEPQFVMMWGDTVPKGIVRDAAGRETEITVVAGRYGEYQPPSPPPRSWASRPEADVAIWTLKMAPGARFTLPAASTGNVNRTLYFFRGSQLRIGPRVVPGRRLVEVRTDAATLLENGPDEAEILILQGKPIGETVAQYGPFVMNTQAEIRQAFQDYQRTRFGGWPWGSDGPVHAREDGRFARHPDGRTEKAT